MLGVTFDATIRDVLEISLANEDVYTNNLYLQEDAVSKIHPSVNQA